jgi:hypothetical protein
MRRNLLYFCYPIRSEMLIENLQRLSLHYPIFDGKKVLFFAIDADTLNHSDIISLLKYYGVFYDPNTEFFFVKNNPQIRETAHFLRMLDEMRKRAEAGSITLFAHSKGVKSIHQNDYCLKQWMWRMWEINTDIVKVQHAFKNENCDFAGAFQYTHPYTDIKEAWHFSGTFFWYHYNLYTKDWNKIKPDRHGTESYPATISPIEQSFCLKYKNPKDLYAHETWKEIIKK